MPCDDNASEAEKIMSEFCLNGGPKDVKESKALQTYHNELIDLLDNMCSKSQGDQVPDEITSG